MISAVLYALLVGIQSRRYHNKPSSVSWVNAPQFFRWSGQRSRSLPAISKRRNSPAITRVSQLSTFLKLKLRYYSLIFNGQFMQVFW